MFAFFLVISVNAQEKIAVKKRPHGKPVSRTLSTKVDGAKTTLLEEDLSISPELSIQVLNVLNEYERSARGLYMDSTKNSEDRISKMKEFKIRRDVRLKNMLNADQLQKLKTISLKLKTM
ncbi:hypothetical protein D3C80_1366740 [compost metagenome]